MIYLRSGEMLGPGTPSRDTQTHGGTAIAMGYFSSFVKPDNIRPFFTKASSDWTVVPTTEPQSHSARLPGRYSQNALFLKGVHLTAVMYGPD